MQDDGHVAADVFITTRYEFSAGEKDRARASLAFTACNYDQGFKKVEVIMPGWRMTEGVLAVIGLLRSGKIASHHASSRL